MKSIVTFFALAACLAFGAGVQTAPFGDLGMNANVVTNVTLDGLASSSNTYTKAEADARIVALAPVPGNYGVVSNRAMNAQMHGDLSSDVWLLSAPTGNFVLVKKDERHWQHPREGDYEYCLFYEPPSLWTLRSSLEELDCEVEGAESSTNLTFVQNGNTYNASRGGRLALNTDIAAIKVPEWPVQLITTNAPLIFADGQDTNVTSIALRAQPTNYTSLSFLHPVSYYLPNRFSLLELGNDYQIVGSQWFQIGRYLYAQNPENIVFVGSGRHRSLQDYLDACAPETLADLLSCYVPTNGGGRIHGDLEIDGRRTAGELITITNSDIHAKGFQVVNKVLTADGLTASNGMVRLNCARFVLGFGTPRMHLETNTLSAITYGGTWDNPEGTMQGLLRSTCQDLLAGNTSYQSIEDRDPYVRYNNVKKSFFDWDLKSLPVNAGPLKHFDLQTGKTHYFTDADVGREGIELRFYTNTHVRVVYDFETAPPSSVYVRCNDSADGRATILSNGSELLYPTAGQRTLFEIEPLSNGTFMVKETALTFMDNVGSWEEANYGAQEEEP